MPRSACRRRQPGPCRMRSMSMSDRQAGIAIRIACAVSSASPSGSIVITTRNVTLALGRPPARVEILRGIDLDVAAGESVALLGPSGSGKSSLMAAPAGLERPRGGEVHGGRFANGRLPAAPPATGAWALCSPRHAERPATLFVIPHDPELAARCARVIELADGRIVAERTRR